MDAGGPQLEVVQGEGRIVGRHRLRGRVVGLVVAVRVVLLNLTVVLEDAGRQLDWGDRASVSDILCVAHRPGSKTSQRARQTEGESPERKMADPPPQEAARGFGLLGFDWVSETGGGSGIKRKEQETQRDKGYQGLLSQGTKVGGDNTES